MENRHAFCVKVARPGYLFPTVPDAKLGVDPCASLRVDAKLGTPKPANGELVLVTWWIRLPAYLSTSCVVEPASEKCRQVTCVNCRLHWKPPRRAATGAGIQRACLRQPGNWKSPIPGPPPPAPPVCFGRHPRHRGSKVRRGLEQLVCGVDASAAQQKP